MFHFYLKFTLSAAWDEDELEINPPKLSYAEPVQEEGD